MVLVVWGLFFFFTQLVLDGVFQYCRTHGDVSAVIVTHKPVVAARCDSVVVLKSGRVAMHGKHSDLMSSNPAYQQLWQQQKQDHHK